MILIDFQGGTHGNFLESILNGIHVSKRLDSFNELGASHSKPYDPSSMLFCASHHSFGEPTNNILHYSDIILITIDRNDLPKVQLNVWLRAGNANVDFQSVEQLENILKFKDNLGIKHSHPIYKDMYDRLMSWTEIQNGEINFNAIREMIKGSFNPAGSGFIQKQIDVESKYPASINVIKFPFSAFYNWDIFLIELKNTLLSLQMSSFIPDFVYDQHKQFLSLNKVTNVFDLPLYYFNKLVNGEGTVIEGMGIYQEAYLDYLYENYYSVEALFLHPDSKYFQSTGEILLYVEQKLSETKV